MNRLVVDGVYWVGWIDWTIRDFHGYETKDGSTYNSYLLLDDEPTLIDAVKEPYAEYLLQNIAELLPPEKIRWVVCNHAEPDHSGALEKVLKACPNATLVCDAKCQKTLSRYFDVSNWKFKIVQTGDSLKIGRRTLEFIETPMAHWPESMATWLPDAGLLFSMDAFGQHYASSERFDDEVEWPLIREEAKTYVANILMLYGVPVAKAVAAVRTLAPKIIAPSHGIIWRTRVDDILNAYSEWDVCRPKKKVLIFYDTMWKSTEKMAQAIFEGASEVEGVDVRKIYVRASHRTIVATEILDAATVAVGSATLNMGMMPALADALTYVKGLRPVGKAGFAFGSYGWGRGGAEDVEKVLQEMKVELLRPVLKANYLPDAADLAECRAAGRMLAERAAGVE